MSTVADTTAELGLPLRLLTIADVAVLPTDLPSGPTGYELDRGKLLVLPPPGYLHARSQSRVLFELTRQGEATGFGQALGEIGLVLWRNPDRLVGPDAAFVSNSRLPVRVSPEGYLDTIPELVVEVRSKNDSWPRIEAKVQDYHAAGVLTVWVLDQRRTAVVVYRAGAEAVTVGPDQELTIEELIPGFRVVAGDLFQA